MFNLSNVAMPVVFIADFTLSHSHRHTHYDTISKHEPARSRLQILSCGRSFV